MPGRSERGVLAAACVLMCLTQPGGAAANNSDIGITTSGHEESRSSARAPSGAALVILANQSLDARARAREPAKSAKTAAGRPQSPPRADGRAGKPLLVATAADAGEPGYVHYFILQLPDESLEIHVGIELPDRRIAWSFPGMGVVVSPLIEAGAMRAGENDYYLWHLYGIRPFPDDAAMAVLRRELATRVNRRVEAGTPYCENDGPRGNCMSCLGFVLRVLFPGRNGDFPDLPRDFWRMGYAGKYSTHDLLLYLTGMLDLPNREARLQRIAQLTLPDALREDLSALVYDMNDTERAPGAGAPQRAAQKRRATSKSAVRPAPRDKL